MTHCYIKKGLNWSRLPFGNRALYGGDLAKKSLQTSNTISIEQLFIAYAQCYDWHSKQLLLAEFLVSLTSDNQRECLQSLAAKQLAKPETWRLIGASSTE